MSGDYYWNQVHLLLELEGANNSNVFTDLSSKALTVTNGGNAFYIPLISTAFSKVGSSCTYIKGSSNVSYQYGHLRFRLYSAIGTGSFTYECWVYRELVGSNSSSTLFSTLHDSSYVYQSISSSMFTILINSGKVYFQTSDLTLSTGAILTEDEWIHVAVSRDSEGVVRIFVNGVLSATGSTTNNFTVDYATIGETRYPPSSSSIYNSTTYIDNIRLTYACRYIEDFTPSTSAYPLFYGTEFSFSGTVYEKNAFGVYVPGSYPVFAYRRSDGGLAGSTTSAVDGTYELIDMEPVEHYLVALDNNEPYRTAAIADKVIPT